MKIELTAEEFLEGMRHDIIEEFSERFNQWTEDGENCIMKFLYRPVSDFIINKFKSDEKFRERMTDRIIHQIVWDDVDMETIREKAEQKAIDIYAKELVKKLK